MNIRDLQREAHATELGTPSYACKVRECFKVQTWSADEMFWWPGDWRHERGWYCWDCSHGILEDVQLIRLDQVLDPDVTTKPWPGVPIVSEPTFALTSLYICGGSCEMRYHRESLAQYDNVWLCDTCMQEWKEYKKELEVSDEPN